MSFVKKYRIADYNLKIEYLTKNIGKFMRKFEFDFEKEDLEIVITPEKLEKGIKDNIVGATVVNVERSLIYREFAEWLAINDSTVFHGVLLDIGGVGVQFTALSGTGKTTHAKLWQQLLGERMKVVDGDKPIFRLKDDKIIGYGTPWNGKEYMGYNGSVEVKHVCFIERSEKNFVEKVSNESVINRIFNQIFIPHDPLAVVKIIQLVDRIVKDCDLWIIHCNTDLEAAEISYKKIIS